MLSRRIHLGTISALVVMCFLGLPLVTSAMEAILIENPSAVQQHSDDDFQQLVDDGRGALDDLNFTSARRDFQDGLDHARGQSHSRWERIFIFYLALSHQQQSQTVKDPSRRQGHLKRAAAYYERSLRLKADSGSVLNNLAKIYDSLGESKKAGDYLKGAVELNDGRFGFYAKNYADHLVKAGDRNEAFNYYRLSAQKNPSPSFVHRQTMELGIEGKRISSLIEYLQALEQQGYESLAQDGALDILRKATPSVREKKKLLDLVVTILSERVYDPAGFAKSKVGLALRRLAADPDIGKPAQQVLLLHQKPPAGPRPFRYWNIGPPSVTFAKLTKQLGSWYMREASLDSAKAEAYFMLTLELTGGDDPGTFLQLVNLFADSDRIKDIKNLSRSYVPALFQAKGRQYQKGDLKKIYSYHRALGVLFSYLGEHQKPGNSEDFWGDEDTITSAIFQLDHALQIAREARIDYDTGLIDLLEKGYVAKSRPKDVIKLRLKAAEDSIYLGRVKQSKRVLAPLKTRKLTDVQKLDFKKVQKKLSIRRKN